MLRGEMLRSEMLGSCPFSPTLEGSHICSKAKPIPPRFPDLSEVAQLRSQKVPDSRDFRFAQQVRSQTRREMLLGHPVSPTSCLLLCDPSGVGFGLGLLGATNVRPLLGSDRAGPLWALFCSSRAVLPSPIILKIGVILIGCADGTEVI